MCLVRINGGEDHWREMLANPSKVVTRSFFLSSHYWGQITATSSFQVAGGRYNRKTMKDRAGENINYLVYFQFQIIQGWNKNTFLDIMIYFIRKLGVPPPQTHFQSNLMSTNNRNIIYNIIQT